MMMRCDVSCDGRRCDPDLIFARTLTPSSHDRCSLFTREDIGEQLDLDAILSASDATDKPGLRCI